MSREQQWLEWAAKLDFDTHAAIKIGGNYVAVLRDGAQVYVSGQIPRLLDTVVVTGRAGEDVTLAQAQYAAQVCAMRALSCCGKNWAAWMRCNRFCASMCMCKVRQTLLCKAKWRMQLQVCCLRCWAQRAGTRARLSVCTNCRKMPRSNWIWWPQWQLNGCLCHGC